LSKLHGEIDDLFFKQLFSGPEFITRQGFVDYSAVVKVLTTSVPDFVGLFLCTLLAFVELIIFGAIQN
jgi:hypothetical protein